MYYFETIFVYLFFLNKKNYNLKLYYFGLWSVYKALKQETYIEMTKCL